MNANDVLKATLQSTQKLLSGYLSDLSDSDLLRRPCAGANHIAWQIGHLISAEIHLIKEQLSDAKYPELPAGFREKHAKDKAQSDSASDFLTKAEYLDLFNKVRNATIEAVSGLTESDLDKPSQGVMAPFAPRVGDMIILVANHTLMHGGQFTVIRRALGKPVLF